MDCSDFLAFPLVLWTLVLALYTGFLVSVFTANKNYRVGMFVFPAIGGWVHWLGASNFSAYADEIDPYQFIWILVIGLVLTIGVEYFVATSPEMPLFGSPEFAEYRQKQKAAKVAAKTESKAVSKKSGDK